MKKVVRLILISLIGTLSGGLFAQSFSAQSGTISTNTMDSCSTAQVDVRTYLGCINWQMGATNVSVSSSTIDVEVHYTSSPICAGAISYPMFNASVSGVSPGSYTVTASAYLDRVYVNTITIGNLMVTNCVATDLTESENTRQLKIYPIPADNFVFLERIDKNESYNYELIDISGKVVKSGFVAKNSAQVKIDCSSLNNGLYFIKTIGEGSNTLIQKLVVR